MELTKIQLGDDVRHSNPLINGGLGMPVLEMNDNETMAKCPHFAGIELVHTETWFLVEDLTVIHKANSELFD